VTTRVLPPNGVATTTSFFGRTYSCSADGYLDVPDADATILAANGWTIGAHAGVSTTAGRPTTGLVAGKMFLDTTLGYIIKWAGKSWINPLTSAVV